MSVACVSKCKKTRQTTKNGQEGKQSNLHIVTDSKPKSAPTHLSYHPIQFTRESAVLAPVIKPHEWGNVEYLIRCLCP